MSAADLLDRLRRLDVAIVLDGDRLRLNGPKAALTPELHGELRERRDELVELLRKVDGSARATGMVPMQETGTRPPFFCVPGHNGDVFCYRPLSRSLGADQPFFAYQPPGVDGREAPLERVEELAERFVREVLASSPAGPFRLGGYCTGGIIAYEAAQQLLARGEEVAALVLLGTPSVGGYALSHRLRATPVRAFNRVLRLASGDPRQAAEPEFVAPELESTAEDRGRVERATTEAVRRYEPKPFPGRVVLIVPSDDRRAMYCERYMDWSELAGGGLAVHAGPSGTIHSRMLRPPAVDDVAKVLSAELERCGG